MKWYGHIHGRQEPLMVNRIIKWKPDGDRKRGSPKIRGEGKVLNDMRIAEIANWKQNNQRQNIMKPNKRRGQK